MKVIWSDIVRIYIDLQLSFRFLQSVSHEKACVRLLVVLDELRSCLTFRYTVRHQRQVQ